MKLKAWDSIDKRSLVIITKVKGKWKITLNLKYKNKILYAIFQK